MRDDLYIGIDPGYGKSKGRGGAAAVIDGDGVPVEVFMINTVEYKLAKKAKPRYKVDTVDLAYHLNEILRRHYSLVSDTTGMRHRIRLAPVAAIEHPIGTPQGKRKAFAPVASIASLSMSFGAIWALLDEMCAEVIPVFPISWRSALKVENGKEGALGMARRMFPGVDLRNKSKHNIAEALLIAEYGRLRAQSSKQQQPTGGQHEFRN